MRILAIDLGKFKSVACVYNTADASHAFETIETTPQVVHDLIVKHEPGRVVIEIGPSCGWVCDLAGALSIEVQVANPNHDAWRWKSTKRKTDRDDALKLARLSAMDQLPQVVIPDRRVRQWRSLITYRHTLVRRRASIKVRIRSLYDRQGLKTPSGKQAWSSKGVEVLREDARSLTTIDADSFWRGELDLELRALEHVESLIREVEDRLDTLATLDDRVRRLQTVPGVGPRLAELVVAMIDDPKRFRNARQVGAYAGLVPRQFESGTMQRQGGITKRGNHMLRALLVEVGWMMLRYNDVFRSVFERACRGQKSRRKIAVVAVARKVLVCCWAMLRDGTTWRPPPGTGVARAVPG